MLFIKTVTAGLGSFSKVSRAANGLKKLGIKKGDRVMFKIEQDKVVLNKLPYADHEYLDSLSNVLVEWSSLEDEEAYNDL